MEDRFDRFFAESWTRVAWLHPPIALHGVIGYRALSVDFTEDSHFGKNTLDFVQHGPILGGQLPLVISQPPRAHLSAQELLLWRDVGPSHSRGVPHGT